MARTTINSLGIPADTIVSADLDYPLTDFSSTGIDDNATSTAITIDSSENTTFAGTITSGDITVADATPFIRLQDSDVTNGYTQISNVNGNAYIGARNDSADGSFLIGGYGGGTFTEFARWNEVGNFTQLGLTTFTGDVLISEATPGITLDDSDNANAELKIIHSSGSSYYRARGVTGYGAHIFQRNNDGATHLNVFATNLSGDAIFYGDDGSTQGMFWDASTERLGIGTTSPSRLLTLSDSGDAIFSLVSTTANTCQVLFGDSVSDSVGRVKYDNSDNSMALFTSQTERMRINSVGNVLIGRTDATLGGGNGDDLQIGSGSGGAGLTIHSSTSGNGDIQFADGTSGDSSYRGLIRYKHADDEFELWTAGARRVTLDSAGKVGIGTAGPNYALDVVGAIRATNSSGSTIIANRTSNPGSVELQHSGTQTAQFSALSGGGVVTYTGSTPTERMRIDAGGSVLIGKTTPTDLHNTWNHLIIGEKGAIISQNGAGGIAGIFVADNVYIDDATGTYAYQESAAASFIRQTGGEITFNNAASGTAGAAATLTERMRIKSDGKVGIGESVPDGPLHVKGSTNRTIIADSTFSSGSFTTVAFRRNGSDKWRITQQSDDSHLSFYNDALSSYQMSLKSDGNVGIGTTSPSCRTSVKGTWTSGEGIFQVDADSGTQYSGLTFQNNGTAHTYFYDDNTNNYTFLGSVAGKSLVFATNTNGTSNERMRIDSSGNIGINQNTPDAQLTLNPPNYTSTATGGMIKWKNSNNSGHSNIQSYFVSGQGSDLNIGANAYINTSGAWSRWSTGLATSAIACRRDGNINFVTNSSSGNGITRAVLSSDGQLFINRTSSISTGTASKLCITGNIDIDGNPGSTNVIRMYQSATEMGQIYGHTTGLRFYNFTGGVTSIKTQADATLQLIPGAGGNDAQIQLCGNGGNIAVEGFEIWYDNDVGDVHLNTTYGNDVSAIRFHTRVGAAKSTINERLTITGGGDVGISATSPSAIISSSRILQVASGGNTTLSVRSTDAVNDRSAILELLSSGNGNSKSIIMYGDTDTTPSSPSILSFQSYHSGVRTERLILNPDGSLLVNSTSVSQYAQTSGIGNLTWRADNGSAAGSLIVTNNADRGWALAYFNKFAYSSGDDNRLINWYTNGTSIGNVTTNGSTVTYGGTSDYRKKQNIVSLSNAIDRVKQLNPIRFEWIDEITPGTFDGFLAHEVQEVVPEAVDGIKDAVDEDGEIKPQSMDPGKLIPLLTAAIQEQQAMIETLQAELTALKGE